jgi:hypothetical protein
MRCLGLLEQEIISRTDQIVENWLFYGIIFSKYILIDKLNWLESGFLTFKNSLVNFTTNERDQHYIFWPKKVILPI